MHVLRGVQVQRGRVDALRPLNYARPASQEGSSGSIECPAIIADPQGTRRAYTPTVSQALVSYCV
jgi:hypothetical protein